MKSPHIACIIALLFFGLCSSWIISTANSRALSQNEMVQSVENLIEYSKVNKSLMENEFTTNRGLKEYQQALGAEFKKRLLRLIEKSHWIDSGAGDAIAVEDYLKSVNTIEHKAQVTAIGLVVKADQKRLIDELSKTSQKKFRYLTGEYIEDLPMEIISRADLITDVFGPMSYTARMSELLRVYAGLLKPGGSLLAVTPFTTTVISQTGKNLSFRHWLLTRSNIGPYRILPGGSASVVIEKKAEGTLNLPSLRLLSIKNAEPPERIFTEQ